MFGCWLINFIQRDNDYICLQQKLLMNSGRGAIVRMGSPQTMSFDDINLVEAFKKFGFDVKTQSCEVRR